MALALDISNYTDEITFDTIRQWRDGGVALVIIQAFPAGYAQYAEQRRQMRTCATAQMPFDAYVFDYLGDPSWRDGCLAGLTQIRAEFNITPRQLWLDVEDVETERGWPSLWRIQAVLASLQACDTFGGPTGIYSAKWYWDPYMGGYDGFAWRELWAAQYDGDSDPTVFTPFGGWTAPRIKQYAGTSVFLGVSGVDLDVLSVQEESELNPSCDTYKAALERAINRLQIELAKKSLSKPIVREISGEMFAALQS